MYVLRFLLNPPSGQLISTVAEAPTAFLAIWGSAKSLIEKTTFAALQADLDISMPF